MVAEIAVSVFDSTRRAEARHLHKALFSVGGGVGFWWVFVQLAAGHAFVGGGDFFSTQKFFRRWLGSVGRPSVRCGKDSRRAFGNWKIVQSVGAGRVELGFVGGLVGVGDAFVGAECFARQRFKLFQAG